MRLRPTRAIPIFAALMAAGLLAWVVARALQDGTATPDLAPAAVDVPSPGADSDPPPAPERLPLTGVVWDHRSRPRPGARVEAGGQRTETDADGRFRIDGLPPGPVEVTIWAEGHGLETRTVQPGVEARVRVRPIRPLSGVVAVPGGGSLPGATVLVRNSSGVDTQLTTDDEGRFSISHLPAGQYTVLLSPHVDADGVGWLRTYQKIDSSRRGGGEIALTPVRGSVIRGTVTAPDGTPCEGALCQAKGRALGGGSTSILHGSRTDDEGRFELVVRVDLPCTVLVDTPDEQTGWRHQRWFRGKVTGDSDEELQVQLEQGTTIAGRIAAPRGVQMGGREIGAYRRVGRDRKHICTGHIADDGTFELRGLWDAYYELRVEGVGGRNDKYVLDSGYRVKSGTMDVSARLVVPRRFAGVVHTADGELAANLGVIVHHTTAGWSGFGRTDADGAFAIERTPPGHLRLIILKPGRNAGSWELGEFRADDQAAIIHCPGRN